MEGTVGTEVHRGGYGRSPTALSVSSVISVASSPSLNRPLVKRAVLVNGWEHPWGCPAETGGLHPSECNLRAERARQRMDWGVG
jgi:hypothetical protein